MTNEEIRFKIAKRCGYIFPINGGIIAPDGTILHHLYSEIWRLPDYENDLNAMHEAEVYAKEHVWNADQLENYGRLLYKSHPTVVITNATAGGIDYYDLARLLIETTAAQRAEAFLRTFNEWED